MEREPARLLEAALSPIPSLRRLSPEVIMAGVVTVAAVEQRRHMAGGLASTSDCELLNLQK